MTMRTLASVWWIDHKSVLKTVQEPPPSTAAHAFCLCVSQQSLHNFCKTCSRDETVLLLQRFEDFHETINCLPRLTWFSTMKNHQYCPVSLFSLTLLHIGVVPNVASFLSELWIKGVVHETRCCIMIKLCCFCLFLLFQLIFFLTSMLAKRQSRKKQQLFQMGWIFPVLMRWKELYFGFGMASLHAR